MSYMNRVGRAPAVAVALSAMVLVSACGSSTKAGQTTAHNSTTRSTSSSATSTTDTTESTQSATNSTSGEAPTPASTDAGLLKFVRCLRAHGIDVSLSAITTHGSSVTIKGIDTSSPQYQRIGHECLGIS